MTLLEAGKKDFLKEIEPFCKNENESIRSQAFYSLGTLKNKNKALDLFILGLSDPSPRVVRTALQALDHVKDARLLDSFKKIAHRFKSDEEYVLNNLAHRVKEFGFKSLEDFKSQNP